MVVQWEKTCKASLLVTSVAMGIIVGPIQNLSLDCNNMFSMKFYFIYINFTLSDNYFYCVKIYNFELIMSAIPEFKYIIALIVCLLIVLE